MQLLIDADGCPVVDLAITEAVRLQIPCTLVCDTAHQFDRPGVRTIVVSKGADSADFAIVERLQAGDVVVTQDIGLASMVLGRDAAAIGVRGRVYDKATIDMQLFIRHEEKKVRRAGGRTRGPAAFTSEDRARFKRNLTELLH